MQRSASWKVQVALIHLPPTDYSRFFEILICNHFFALIFLFYLDLFVARVKTLMVLFRSLIVLFNQRILDNSFQWVFCFQVLLVLIQPFLCFASHALQDERALEGFIVVRVWKLILLVLLNFFNLHQIVDVIAGYLGLRRSNSPQGLLVFLLFGFLHQNIIVYLDLYKLLLFLELLLPDNVVLMHQIGVADLSLLILLQEVFSVPRGCFNFILEPFGQGLNLIVEQLYL